MDYNQVQIYTIPLTVMRGTQIASISRYRIFNHQYLYVHGNFFGHQARRFLVGLLMCILFPVLIMYFGSIILSPVNDGVNLLVVSSLYSMTLFSLTRLTHSILLSESSWSKFYSEWEANEILTKMHINRLYNRLHHHLMPGVCYLIFWPILSYCLSLLIKC